MENVLIMVMKDGSLFLHGNYEPKANAVYRMIIVKISMH